MFLQLLTSQLLYVCCMLWLFIVSYLAVQDFKLDVIQQHPAIILLSLVDLYQSMHTLCELNLIITITTISPNLVEVYFIFFDVNYHLSPAQVCRNSHPCIKLFSSSIVSSSV